MERHIVETEDGEQENPGLRLLRFASETVTRGFIQSNLFTPTLNIGVSHLNEMECRRQGRRDRGGVGAWAE